MQKGCGRLTPFLAWVGSSSLAARAKGPFPALVGTAVPCGPFKGSIPCGRQGTVALAIRRGGILHVLHFLHVQRVAGGADVERLSAGNRRMLKNPGIDRHMFLELCAPPGFCSRKLAVK